jgi:hypothetical protein
MRVQNDKTFPEKVEGTAIAAKRAVRWINYLRGQSRDGNTFALYGGLEGSIGSANR